MDRTFFSVSGSPARTSAVTNSERRNWRFPASCGVGVKWGLPSAFSTVRTLSTRARNSCGSSENALSGPGAERDSVKCFSITHAPRATDAIAVSLVSV